MTGAKIPNSEDTLLDDDHFFQFGKNTAIEALLGRILAVLADQGVDVESMVEEVQNVNAPPVKDGDAETYEALRTFGDGITLTLESVMEQFDKFRESTDAGIGTETAEDG